MDGEVAGNAVEPVAAVDRGRVGQPAAARRAGERRRRARHASQTTLLRHGLADADQPARGRTAPMVQETRFAAHRWRQVREPGRRQATGREAVDAFRDVADTFGDAVEDSLKRRPYATLAVVAGIGFLFGAAWKR